jgi:Family of unknown function (DUF6266)
MGTIEKGYLGGFSGKVGTAVGSSWKNLNVLRSRPPRKRRGQPSDLQLERQAKFTVITNFLQPLTDLLNQTYKKSASGEMSGFNKGFSVNSQAITGVYPDFAVDYAKVQLSKGSLPDVTSPSATSPTAGKLVFTWTDNSKFDSKALISDMAFVAAYNPESGRWISIEKAASRNTGTYTLDVAPFSGKPVQTYLGFMSADRRKVAPSQYTGLVNVL